MQTPKTQSLQRKWRCWWLLAQTLATCVYQLRSLSIWTPKYLYEMTCLMSWPYMATELWFPIDLESSNISRVLDVFICSRCSSHQSVNLSTAALWLLVLELFLTVNNDCGKIFTANWLEWELTVIFYTEWTRGGTLHNLVGPEMPLHSLMQYNWIHMEGNVGSDLFCGSIDMCVLKKKVPLCKEKASFQLFLVTGHIYSKFLVCSI